MVEYQPNALIVEMIRERLERKGFYELPVQTQNSQELASDLLSNSKYNSILGTKRIFESIRDGVRIQEVIVLYDQEKLEAVELAPGPKHLPVKGEEERDAYVSDVFALSFRYPLISSDVVREDGERETRTVFLRPKNKEVREDLELQTA